MKEDFKSKGDLGKSINGLKEFQNFSKLKKIVLSFFAYQLNEQEFALLGEVFKSFDENGDGYLTLSEIRKAIS
jgi:hypothetical protein